VLNQGVGAEWPPYWLREVLPPPLWVQSSCKVVVHGYSKNASTQDENELLAWRRSKSRNVVEHWGMQLMQLMQARTENRGLTNDVTQKVQVNTSLHAADSEGGTVRPWRLDRLVYSCQAASDVDLELDAKESFYTNCGVIVVSATW